MYKDLGFSASVNVIIQKKNKYFIIFLIFWGVLDLDRLTGCYWVCLVTSVL